MSTAFDTGISIEVNRSEFPSGEWEPLIFRPKTPPLRWELQYAALETTIVTAVVAYFVGIDDWPGILVCWLAATLCIGLQSWRWAKERARRQAVELFTMLEEIGGGIRLADPDDAADLNIEYGDDDSEP